MNKHEFAETQIAEAQQFCQKHNNLIVHSVKQTDKRKGLTHGKKRIEHL